MIVSKSARYVFISSRVILPHLNKWQMYLTLFGQHNQ